jgi:hypothetical protein
MPVSMVGRAGELAELVHAWAEVAGAGRPVPRTAVITGAAGIGKSLLIAAALEAFVPRPPVVLSGTARVHTPAPYDWGRSLGPGRRSPGPGAVVRACTGHDSRINRSLGTVSSTTPGVTPAIRSAPM